jgi:hypothetical protein
MQGTYSTLITDTFFTIKQKLLCRQCVFAVQEVIELLKTNAKDTNYNTIIYSISIFYQLPNTKQCQSNAFKQSGTNGFICEIWNYLRLWPHAISCTIDFNQCFTVVALLFAKQFKSEFSRYQTQNPRKLKSHGCRLTLYFEKIFWKLCYQQR